MAQFVYFTPQEKETARNADIAEMLERQGERLKRSGSEFEWGEGSERVTIRGNLLPIVLTSEAALPQTSWRNSVTTTSMSANNAAKFPK